VQCEARDLRCASITVLSMAMIPKSMGLAAMLVLLIAAGATAEAQSMLQVPQSQSQPQPRATQSPAARPAPPSSATLQLAPATQPPAPAPPARAPAVAPQMQLSAPVLPQVFRGCWQGEVARLDWIKRMPGGHPVGYWTPKTYRLCYKRVGDGPFKLTFSETGVAPSEKIINPRGQVVAIATDGRAYAKLRSYLHFDEYAVHPARQGLTFTVDETTLLDAKIAGGEMLVSAEVYGTRDTEPWFRAHWRARFRPVAQ
jgi:hypothetical protein